MSRDLPPEGGLHRDSGAEAAAHAAFALLPPPPPLPVLDTDHLRSVWALDIAVKLQAMRRGWIERDPHVTEIDECWIGAEDLAIYVRYAGRWGHRVGDLHLDVWLGGPARSAAEQAADICHDLDAGGDKVYSDELGYAWFGDDPLERGWHWSVATQPRLSAPLPASDPVRLPHEVASALTARATEEEATHPHDPAIEDCWVGEDLALYTRSRYNGELRGHRAGDLGRGRLKPEFDVNARNLARQLWLELGAATEPSYVDQRGYRWSGDDPEAPVTWEYVIERMARAEPVD